MSKIQYYSMDSRIRFFLEQGKEGECWDFKQEWHENIADLIKDIICFANTVHNDNCYLIFGVADNLDITGMKKPRRKQADIIDSISNLFFAGDVYPTVEVETIVFNGTELDVLTIFNIENTPIYLKKQYGKMRPGCIYTRIGDKNTPDNGNADVSDIENLWQKRFGLTKPPLEYIFDRLHNKTEWNTTDNGYYNVYRPEYTIEIYPDQKNFIPEFYAYVMPDSNTIYYELNIKCHATILCSYQIVVLDGGRLWIPVPDWGYVCDNKSYSYKYYVCDSKNYKLLKFLYNPENGDHRYAFMLLQNVVLFFLSDEERLAFETYIKKHPNLLIEKICEVKRFDYITTDSDKKTKVYKERLNVGFVLNELLEEWRNTPSL